MSIQYRPTVSKEIAIIRGDTRIATVLLEHLQIDQSGTIVRETNDLEPSRTYLSSTMPTNDLDPIVDEIQAAVCVGSAQGFIQDLSWAVIL